MTKKIHAFLFTLLCFFTTLQAQQSQDIRISLSLSHQTLQQAIKEMETRTPYRFSYSEDILVLYRQHITLKAEQQTIRYVLDHIFNGSPLNYKIVGTRVVLQENAPVPPKRNFSGRIVDVRTNTPLPGVSIKLKTGNGGVVTDENGNFTIASSEKVPVFVISYIGYSTQERKWEENLIVRLKEDVKMLRGVQVMARQKLNTEQALLNDRRNSAVVQDAISAANIEKTASITTTQALQRVTGVTITDDRYVAIRGLGDRSVVAELNGARLSSADPDKSAVPLDLVPAGLLDNITVYKTLTPDKPADASAGIVSLKTRSIPDSLTLQFTMQIGMNSSIGMGGNYNSYRNSNLGFFGQKVKESNLSTGFKGLQDQYPGGLPAIQRMFISSRNSPALAAEALRVNNIMREFDPVLTTSYKKANLNQIYSVSFGNSFKVFRSHQLGLVLSGSYYSRTEDRYRGEVNQYSIYQGVVTGSEKIFSPLHIPGFITPDNPRLGKYIGYRENSGVTVLNYGILAGITYRFNQRNEVQFQYIGSRGAEAQGNSLTGAWENTGLQFPVYNQVYQLRKMYRTFNTYNLQGEHKILDKVWSPQIGYNLSISRSVQNEPDFRFTNLADYRKTSSIDAAGKGIVSDVYAFVTGSAHGVGNNDVVAADPNGRKFRDLTEKNYNTKVDLSQPFLIAGRKQLFKVGYNFLKRERKFNENVLGLPGTTIGGDNGLLDKVNGNLSALISYDNIGLKYLGGNESEGQPRVGGFLYQIKKSPNNYKGTYETQAVYGMIDAHILEHLRFVGGVRFEYTDIQAYVDTSNVFNPIATSPNASNINVSATTSKPYTHYQQELQPYYSANLTYAWHDMNFRVAYSTSLARPELRELTNIYEFDPFQFAVVSGNPNLKNQHTQSLDFRWEWFPHPNEVIAASVFTKHIKDQLTKVFKYRPQGSVALFPEFPVIQFQNDPNPGKLFGIELEVRKDLGRLWRPLQHFFIGTNVMIASSAITKNPERLEAARTIDRKAAAQSPLFEQAPYSVNTYLDYSNGALGANFTASFNIVGERLVQVQLDGSPDVFSRPVPMLDFVASKRLFRRFIIKGFAKNVLNPAYLEVYANPKNNGLYNGVQYVHHRYYRGAEFSLGLTYMLF